MKKERRKKTVLERENRSAESRSVKGRNRKTERRRRKRKNRLKEETVLPSLNSNFDF